MVKIINTYHFGCHGIPDRCYTFGGSKMSFCARCFGVSIGHVGAFIGYLIDFTSPVWVVPIGLGIMLIDWYLQNRLKKYHSNNSRFITGILGGYAVGLALWHLFNMVVIYIYNIT